MEVKIIKTWLVIFVLCGCLQGSYSTKAIDEKVSSNILKKQGVKYTKLPENMYKYGNAPVVTVLRSTNPFNQRQDINRHLDPIKAAKRVVSPVCPLTLIKSQVTEPLKNIPKPHQEDSFIEDDTPECSHKHEVNKSNLNIEASANLDHNNNIVIDGHAATKGLQDNLITNIDNKPERNKKSESPTLNSAQKTVFYEEPIAKVKQNQPHVIGNDALKKVTLPTQQVTPVTETSSNKSICSATNNDTIIGVLNKSDISKLGNNSLPINRVEIAIPTNNVNHEIGNIKSTDKQNEENKPTSLKINESGKPFTPSLMLSNLGPTRRMNINKPATDVLNDVTLNENSDICNTNILPSISVDTDTNLQEDNASSQENNAANNELEDIVIDNHGVDEVVESYKYPYYTGYNMDYNTDYNPAYNYNPYNRLTNEGDMYNRYNPGNCYALNQGLTQEYTNNIPTQYYNTYEPSIYQYEQIDAKQTNQNVIRPDYSLVPPSFKYPTPDLFTRNNIYAANNYANNANEYVPYPLNIDKTPSLWYQQDSSKIQDINDIYGRIPENWTYSQGYYPNRFVDRIFRSWRRTLITLKPVKNNAKPFLMRLKQGGENINKIPVSVLDVRKGLINSNGCYRNQNIFA